MTAQDITNQLAQRAQFAAILCCILSEWEGSDVTHDDIRTIICKSLERMTNNSEPVGDLIEQTLLKRANEYVEQHNAIIEVKQFLS